MPSSIKNKISHRAKALEQLRAHVKSRLQQQQQKSTEETTKKAKSEK